MPNGGFIMMIKLLDKASLSIINRKLKYPLGVAEKDYFLALVLQIIYDSPLRNILIFKGGTALYHTYLPQLRFSEDLDFSTNQIKINPEEVKSIFLNLDIFEIKKDYLSNATYKIERLLYKGPLGQANSLKIEIDFLQNTILPPIEIDYINEYSVNVKVKAMDIKEIAAEKIRAMNDRVKYRDFYDFTMILKSIKPDLSEVYNLIGRKEIRKTISCKNILNNWELTKVDRSKDIQPIYYLKDLSDDEILDCIKELTFPDFIKP
jgi:predicted nucleotidyltransferase component of viral defense system